PDGLAPGGLEVAQGEGAHWEGALAPVQTQAGGRTQVRIQQTAERAILHWDRFDVGRNTTVDFQQRPTDAVLNRVVGADARPSQIQGAIEGAGTVMVLNQNGVVFHAGSQVNTRNLVAAAATLSDAQFRERGIYSNDNAPALLDARGNVIVAAGASLRTRKPDSSTSGGGYVLLAGKSVDNAGSIHTPQGQAVLAAGDNFVIRRGQGTVGNQASTTRGNAVEPGGAGQVRNTGLVQAPLGDVTLAGHKVEQVGVVAATTSVDARGTVHLTARGAGAEITLGEGAVTAVLVDASKSAALDGQRDALLKPSIGANEAVQRADDYRRDLSLIEIDSAGSVRFAPGSLTLATGGQVVSTAGTRTLVEREAQIDVSGAIGVAVDMSVNNLKVNIQGNEQRDAPGARDDATLNNSDVWLDVRELLRVAAGTGGYESERWYSGGGLFEVGGYLATRALPASVWLAQGGVVRFQGAEVVTQQGSSINLSGGTLDVQPGELRQTWLRGADGRLYTADQAPADLLYRGVYKGYELASARWGATTYYYNPLLAPVTRHAAGYTVGRDAGTVVVSTGRAVLDGDLVSDVYQGPMQTQAPARSLDGLRQSHRAQARRAELVVGTYQAWFDTATGGLRYALGPGAGQVSVGDHGPAGVPDLAAPLPPERQGAILLDAGRLNDAQLGALRIAAAGQISVDSALRLADGGEFTLY
ncbi:two-partner secretion domain-containing protein, partial [Bordetella hinzii]